VEPQREHAQAMYDRVIGWYESAERKAQLILTLDGIFLSFLSASAFQKAGDLRETTDSFGPETWALLALMAIALLGSIVSAVTALFSRMYSDAEMEGYLERRGVQRDRPESYRPSVTWFFQDLAQLDPQALSATLLRADAGYAVSVLAENVVALARNVVKKHRFVNWGFILAGATLVFFLAALVSYVAHTA
jgi:hypothetical protein